MYEATRNVLGLMSGTSLDGMDAAIVRFNIDQNHSWELLENYEFSYPNDLKELVTQCFKDRSLMNQLDVAFARWTVECIQKIQSITKVTIDLIGHVYLYFTGFVFIFDKRTAKLGIFFLR